VLRLLIYWQHKRSYPYRWRDCGEVTCASTFARSSVRRSNALKQGDSYGSLLCLLVSGMMTFCVSPLPELLLVLGFVLLA